MYTKATGSESSHIACHLISLSSPTSSPLPPQCSWKSFGMGHACTLYDKEFEKCKSVRWQHEMEHVKSRFAECKPRLRWNWSMFADGRCYHRTLEVKQELLMVVHYQPQKGERKADLPPEGSLIQKLVTQSLNKPSVQFTAPQRGRGWSNWGAHFTEVTQGWQCVSRYPPRPPHGTPDEIPAPHKTAVCVWSECICRCAPEKHSLKRQISGEDLSTLAPWIWKGEQIDAAQ